MSKIKPLKVPKELTEKERQERTPVFGIQMTRGAKFYIEKAKRTTDCRICKTPIKVGRKRVRLVVSRMNPYELRNGGKIFKSVWFAHVTCMKGVFGPNSSSNQNACIGCGEPALHKSKPNGISTSYAIISFSSSYGKLCQKCAESPRWTRCETCTAFAATRHVQSVQSDDGESTQKVCRWCQNELGYVPISKIRAEEAKTERMFIRLQKRIKKSGPW